ncbi:GTPase Era [Corynebacterium sp. TAE3-ERU12]|uniref:GTPase Era n=1 Tax=Corynebacterium sp. TAE3-ERU12 TaxID=2849491 RepID=UPI001C452F0B|nr:GTPase Era [Corynebacterium sp. TAE3-ERU12]MBV7295774.1 GTPase Era [Corynebacterium sp. TAE3-ERU12]
MSESTDPFAAPEGHRSGFVSIVGRPNTGKSTLTNALVGQKIAITADQPETTRHAVRGVVHRPDCQIIVVDTPGLHKPRKLIGQRLNDAVHEAYTDVDLIALAVPADEKIGPGDRWILETVRREAPNTQLLGLVTKTDAAGRDAVASQLMALHELLGPDVELVPVSSESGENLDTLVEVIARHLPEGPKFYPSDHVTDEDTETRIAELIREAALGGLRDELPHSVAVEVDEILPDESRKGLTDIHAVIYVERPGQKLILMGKDGKRMKSTVRKARAEIMDLLGTNIYLDLRMKVLKDWQSDPKSLGRLGF